MPAGHGAADAFRTLGVCAVILLAVTGCSAGGGGRSCKTNSDCPSRQYCSDDKRCTADCQTADDCGGAECNAIGKCVTPSDSGNDGKVGDGIGRQSDGQADLWPTVDVGPLPDGLPICDGRRADRGTIDGRVPDAGQRDRALPPDQRPSVDGRPAADQSVPTGCMVAVIGKPCVRLGNECGLGMTCLIVSGDRGVCTCGCTQDNPTTTTVNEDTCPDGTAVRTRCGHVTLTSGSTANYCFRKCDPKLAANDCLGAMSCEPGSGESVGLLNTPVCVSYGCATDAECHVITPQTCDTQNAALSCPTGEVCVPIATGHTSGLCARAGKCDSISHLCAPHTRGSAAAKIGDPCKSDLACGNAMHCMLEFNRATYQKPTNSVCTSNSECCSGTCTAGHCTAGLCLVERRNGYCSIGGCTHAATLTSAACPAGSACNRLWTGGLCQKSCTLPDALSCRNVKADLYGDYECRAWNNVTLSGVPVATGPVCDIGSGLQCSFLGNTTLNCTALGVPTTNATQMACRGLDGVVKANVYDPLGFCLDTTPSSVVYRNPQPQP